MVQQQKKKNNPLMFKVSLGDLEKKKPKQDAKPRV